jgi:thiol-disulfide isomerase/thioredoxin
MSSRVTRAWATVVMAISAIAGAQAWAGDRTAEEILKEVDAVEAPKFDAAKRNDKTYIKEYIQKMQESTAKRSALAFELYKTDPNHARVPALMVARWTSARGVDAAQIDDKMKEIDEVLGHTNDTKFKVDGTFAKAQLALAKTARSGSAPDLSGVEAFIKLAPKDPRSEQLLYQAARSTSDEAGKVAIEDRLLKDYPDSRYTGMVKGGRRQREAVGKPFELEFTDAIKGTTVSMNGLKGKVVVIDFWATWCGPCVAEMPKMKELYAKYHDQGVEFIGVSLDQPKEQGGLDKLKTFVAENKIGWPQYYQGNFWQSEFSTSWGINAIPCVFIVDTAGKLHSNEARGKLETMIPELLKKKHASEAPAGGGE